MTLQEKQQEMRLRYASAEPVAVKQDKHCSKCKQLLPLSAFSKNKTHKDGLRSECRLCESARYNNIVPRKEAVKAGYIGELFVCADLRYRCERAYLNPEPQTKDDIYIKTSLGWYTVQVKSARTNVNTGWCSFSGGKDARGITSDVIALVDLRGLRIRYCANKRSLPPELRDGLVSFLKEYDYAAS